MKKIGISREPNLRQMLNMVANLREKYKVGAAIDVEAWAYSSGNNTVQYRIYITDFHHIYCESWKECQSAYFRLIKEAPNA